MPQGVKRSIHDAPFREDATSCDCQRIAPIPGNDSAEPPAGYLSNACSAISFSGSTCIVPLFVVRKYIHRRAIRAVLEP